MKYRLGIDLGTSSIGVAAYELDNDNEIKKLLYLDSYIFREPVDPKELKTTNTARRSARLARRQCERKAKRLRKLKYISESLGITQDDIKKSKTDICELRAKAVSEKLS